jgi:hypothetical protein
VWTIHLTASQFRAMVCYAGFLQAFHSLPCKYYYCHISIGASKTHPHQGDQSRIIVLILHQWTRQADVYPVFWLHIYYAVPLRLFLLRVRERRLRAQSMLVTTTDIASPTQSASIRSPDGYMSPPPLDKPPRTLEGRDAISAYPNQEI